MKKFGLIILIITFCHSAFSQTKLSSRAEIHILTCGPYQGELYSAFGHSAIRVVDPLQDLDILFNYGVFDFNQPNFYLNFARGFLHYKLGVTYYSYFKDAYISENRYIHEQVLNLSESQKQEYFNFLQWNAQPEHQYYYYDYFYDNCATRVRDGLKETFGDSLQFDGSYIKTDYTIRDLVHQYLQQQPWGELGIDICLGLPMDVKATPQMYMFLPDYIEKGFDHATIKRGEKIVPLVNETRITNEAHPQPDASSAITPVMVFSAVFIFGLLLSWQEYRKKITYRWFDILLFTITGLLGWLLFLLWVATDHHAAARNFNLLWAVPLYVPGVFLLLRQNIPRWTRMFFATAAVLALITLVFWPWWPQDLHNSLIPFVMLLALRGGLIYRNS